MLLVTNIKCPWNPILKKPVDMQGTVISRNKALQFLLPRSSRVKRSSSLQEECCYETWCDLEEMEERHENNGFSKPIPNIVNWLRKRPNCKYFYCDNGKHIKMQYRCDFDLHCSNGEDEKDCSFSNAFKDSTVTSAKGATKEILHINVNRHDFHVRLEDKNTAEIVFKSLGYSSDTCFLNYGLIKSKKELLISLKCDGTEDSIAKCQYSLIYDDSLNWVSCLKQSDVRLEKERSFKESVYGAAYIAGTPICYTNSWESNSAQVVCNTIKSSSCIGVPFNANIYVNNHSPRYYTGGVLSDVFCRSPKDQLSKCQSNIKDKCTNVAGVACLDDKSFELPCLHCPLKALGRSVIATKLNQWTSKETSVLCRKEHGIPFGRYKQRIADDVTECLISDVKCKGDEEDIRKCSYQWLSKCPAKPFYQITVECLPNFQELIEIIQTVNIQTNDRQLQYNSVIDAINTLNSKYDVWDCTGNPVGKGIAAYCSTVSTLQRLKYLSKPREQKSFIFLRTNHDITVMLSEKLLDERFSSLHTQISTLGTKMTEFQSQLADHLLRLSSFKAEVIKAKVNKRLLPWENQLQILIDSKTNKLKEHLERLVIYAKKVNEDEIAEATKDAIMSIFSAIFRFGNVFSGDAISKATSTVSNVNQFYHTVKAALVQEFQAGTRRKRIQYLVCETQSLNVTFMKFMKRWKSKRSEHEKAFKFLSEIKSKKENFNETTATQFLNRFGTIGVVFGTIDLNEIGITLNNIVGGLCSIITESSTRSDVIQWEAENGLCDETRKSVGSVITVLESINDNGNAISQILVELAELKLEESSAFRLSETLKKKLKSDLEVKLNQLLSIALVKMQKRKLIEEACNKIRYLNFGVEKDFCTRIKQNPEADIGPLISYQEPDMCFNPTALNVLIPVEGGSHLLNRSKNTGTIDLDGLLQKTYCDDDWKTSGEVLFNIPGEGWMAENGWIQKDDQGPFFLKQFEIFMPPQHPKGGVPFRVEANIELFKNKLDGKEYRFDDPVVFGLKYEENNDYPMSCDSDRKFPYNTCAKDQSYSVCVLKEGILPGPYYPTTDSTWKINIRSKYELPKIYSSSPFFLHAKIEICSRTKQVSRLRNYGFSAISISSKPSCCPANQYYDFKERIKATGKNPCKRCPSGTPRMGGYFCEDCPPGMEPGPDVYGCYYNSTTTPNPQTSTTFMEYTQTPKCLALQNTAVKRKLNSMVVVSLVLIASLLADK